MNLPAQLATHIREVHFGGNWTDVNLKDTLAEINWRQATTKVDDLNTIATLLFHMNFYLNAVRKRVEGKELDAKHEDSFKHPPIHSKDEWNQLVEKTWIDAKAFADLVEQLPEEQLWGDFGDKKYGSYFKNIQGVVEHNHYHLGQIVLLKKLISKQPGSNTL